MSPKTRSQNAALDVKKFKAECASAKGSPNVLNAVYNKWTVGRVKYLNGLDKNEQQISKVLRLCPDLKDHAELLLHDYCHRVECVTGKEPESIAQKFRRYVPLIFEQAHSSNTSFLEPKLLDSDPSGSDEYKQLVALKILPQLLGRLNPLRAGWKQPISKYALVVEKPKSVSTSHFVRRIREAKRFGPNKFCQWKHSRRGPLIVVTTSSRKIVEMELLVGSKLLKIQGDPADALELFFAAHYTFGIQFDRAIREAVPFLKRMAGLNKSSRLRFGYKNLIDALEEAK
ncbi:hypothetical protein M3Y97_00525200 [Aphelenchoides bicaudatus]|nr:hypothetical protein M3Y97_00525200 [Aphelenchoides bicaudatus]